MKKISKRVIFCIMSLFFCACTTKENTDKPIMTLTSAPETTETPAETNTLLPTVFPGANNTEEFMDIEKIDWTELTCYADEETSRHNSNFLNYGYLTYDEEGNIYYIDLDNKDFYVSDYNGENKRLLCEDIDYGGCLRVDGEWLYYTTRNTAIMRLNLTTGETEQLKEERSGHFRLENGKMYWDDRANGGFVEEDPDGGNKKLIQDTSLFNTAYYSQGDTLWVTEAGSKANVKNKNYLLTISEDKLALLNQKGYYPLLAGNYLSVVDAKTKRRHIWNLETKEDIDLNAPTDQTIVSDGKVVYYKSIKHASTFLLEGEPDHGYVNLVIYLVYKWDGQNTEEIWRFDADSLYHMFITPKGLYCMPQVKEDGRYKHQLWFYDFETGEKIKIY